MNIRKFEKYARLNKALIGELGSQTKVIVQQAEQKDKKHNRKQLVV